MQMTQAQDMVVKAIAGDGSVLGWERIVADVEIEEHSDGYQFDNVSFALGRSSAGLLSDTSFSLSVEAKNAIIAFFKAFSADPERRFSGFSVEVNASGEYRFAFNHGKARRLNGDWDADKEKKIDHYADLYQPGRWVLTAD